MEALDLLEIKKAGSTGAVREWVLRGESLKGCTDFYQGYVNYMQWEHGITVRANLELFESPIRKIRITMTSVVFQGQDQEKYKGVKSLLRPLSAGYQ
jgi:hypothetical protein